jgi:ATPase subunit of ABC transporter with duplicated ATPase domains
MGSISLKSLGATELFSDLSLVAGEGDRIGLVAGNGMGKTTLLRILAGQQEPSSGDVVRSRGLRVGYVEQDVAPAMLPLTLRDAVLDALPVDSRDTDGWRADVVLDDFGAPEALRGAPVAQLSGGWQRLMLIARVWVNVPDALLLDEPTNHLDLGKILMLERWVAASAGNMPLIIASHDRAFLDATTNRTLFLRPGTSPFFALPYSRARAALAQADEAAARRRELDLKDAAQLRRQAAKLTNIGINSGSDLLTVKAKQLKDRAARIESKVQEVHKERAGEIRLGNSGTHARVLLAIENLTVRTPDGRPLFTVGKLHLFQGDRVVLLGPNGAGKSQFIKLLTRALAGEVAAGLRFAGSLKPGAVDQELSMLPPGARPFELIAAFGEGDQRTRSLLAAAGFPIELQGRRIDTLSFGQRARIALLALRLAEPNFYLLDEPTNHIDIAGQEMLEAEIVEHGASAVVVSHDRSFVRGIGTRFVQIAGSRLVEADSPDAFFGRLAAGANAS